MTISDTGFWILDTNEMNREHRFDKNLCQNIVDLLKKEYVNPKIIDLGCGRCDYTNMLLQFGYNVVGIDGNPNTQKYCSQPNRIIVSDLVKPIRLLSPFDAVICLEVGEHIPAQYETDLIRNIDSLLKPNGLLILSWAIEGQSGYGHINCHNNAYIKNRFNALGYQNLEQLEVKFRENTVLPWFTNTIMLFKKSI